MICTYICVENGVVLTPVCGTWLMKLSGPSCSVRKHVFHLSLYAFVGPNSVGMRSASCEQHTTTHESNATDVTSGFECLSLFHIRQNPCSATPTLQPPAVDLSVCLSALLNVRAHHLCSRFLLNSVKCHMSEVESHYDLRHTDAVFWLVWSEQISSSHTINHH